MQENCIAQTALKCLMLKDGPQPSVQSGEVVGYSWNNKGDGSCNCDLDVEANGDRNIFISTLLS